MSDIHEELATVLKVIIGLTERIAKLEDQQNGKTMRDCQCCQATD